MKNRRFLKAVVVISFLFTQLASFAQCDGMGGGVTLTLFSGPGVISPKAGDDVCTATQLKTGLSCTQYSIDTATASPQPKPSCWQAGTAVQDQWFYFTAISQDMTISTDALLFNLQGSQGSGFGLYDTQLAIYSTSNGTCSGALTQIGCDDNSGTNGLPTTAATGSAVVPIAPATFSPPKQAVIEITGLIPGNVYYVRIGAGAGAFPLFGGTAGGNYCISAFDTFTPGSLPCEAQDVHPNSGACAPNNGNGVINMTSSTSAMLNGMQPNAYVPLGQSYCGGNSPGQYGVWNDFVNDSSATSVTVTNNTTGTRVYTFFSGATCRHLSCLSSQSCAAGASVTFPVTAGTNYKGTTYYILTTLTNGDLTPQFETDLCVKNNIAPYPPPTQKNVGGVPGAGGTVNASQCANAYGITQSQVYQTSTYAAPGSGGCTTSPNVAFYWDVPSTYPATGIYSGAFFQMWNKNCTGGPATNGTDLIVAPFSGNNACTGGACYDISIPSTFSTTAGHDAWSTNIGWSPYAYSCSYIGYFTGDAGAVCDFNFEVNNSPSLHGVESNWDTICQGQSAVLTGSYATAYEWSTGETTTSITVTPTVTTNYTVYAVSGASGYDISTVVVIPYPYTITATPGAICTGVTSVSLTATSTSTSTLTTTYSWTPAASLTPAVGAVVQAHPTVTTTYTVTATLGAGGTFPGCKAVTTTTVTDSPNLPVTVNVATICPGQSATLIASGANSYTWAPATGLSGTTTATVTANPSTTTTYTITGSIGGCTGTTTTTVTVSPIPTITVNNPTVCSGNTATLTAVGGSTYIWQDGSTTNPFVTPAITTATSYSVIGTNANGCSSTAISNISIAPNLSITVNDETICTGLTATLTGSGGTTYTWQAGSFTGNPYTTPALTAAASFTVIGSDVNGCTGTAVANVSIAAGLTISVNDVSYCPGGSGTLTASGGTTYDWSPAAGLSAVTGNGITVNTPTNNTTYTVVGNTNGCTGSAVSTITIFPADNASFSYSLTTVCKTGGSDPTPVITGLAGGTFTATGGLPINAATGIVDLANTPLGTYTVTYTTNNCTNSSNATLAIVNVPVADFTYGTYCQDITNPLPTFINGGSAGVFTESTGNLKFASSTTGEISLSTSVAGNYTVTNSIAAGGSCPAATNSNTITINALPATTASSATMCAGDPPATITAGGATTFLWSDGSTASASFTPSPAPTITTTYTVVGTTAGCSFPATGTITVNPVPTVTVSNPASACGGILQTITASGATSYSWTGGTGTASGLANENFTDTPAPPTTTYTVIGTTNGCTASNIGTMTVNPTPTVTAADAGVCSGLPATLTVNSDIPGTTFVWSCGGQTTLSITVNPPITTTCTVVGTALGCSGSAMPVVTVSPTPTVTVNNATVCAGQTATLTATSTLPATTYLWSDATTLNPDVSTPLTPTVITVVGSVGICASAPASGNITVNPIPTVTVNNPTICAGQQGILTASGASGGYAWSDGSTANPNVSLPLTNTTLTVTGTASNCPSAPVNGNITVNPLPTVTVNSATTCAGQSATLMASGAGTYSWSPGGPGDSITVNPPITTYYTVTGSNLANGLNCSSTATATVTANPLPVAAFSSPVTIKLSEANISFQNNSTHTNANTMWFWDFGDTATSTLQYPQHLYADTGTYIVQLIVTSNGCTDSHSQIIHIVPDIYVYIPNAFTPDGDGLNDGFSFKGTGVASKGFEFRVFDRWGELLFETTDMNKQWMGDYKGKPCQQDTYVYQVIVLDNLGKEKKYLGWVTLVR